ncbi:AAA family ATPase [Acinetobacter radioresistens]|jgi:chromosome partitioning protein|uniref:ParA family protein n=1 Tax=Acinetobacter TaxID=469 RepID=UPI0002CD917B|nr:MULTISPECIES: ParA family protein [Acinetobacter]ENV88164.1 hypothetical protein F940_00010 [Acinetobacter radioresistens NIPH 2130]EXB76894.1 cobQ/CobB/MinD/ParA nucleotide binding domain protein [Acinetobacter sp. 272263]MCK4078659.1 ParA family protein [Acinetobacter radioresistens]MCK4084949.1 ParA family protein [Acinetobacter radioresistens]MCK4087672.1 ParA family protein [Acinetobacter radioresistens]
MSTEKKNTKFITLAQLKGGVGKSTLAVHIAGFLANNGHTVALLDSDSPQYTSTNWYNIGPEKTNIDLGQVSTAEELIAAVNHYEGKVDFVVTDLAPRLEEITKVGLAISDFAVVPVNMDLVEIWALDIMRGLLVKAAEDVPHFNYRVLANKFKTNDPDHQERYELIKSEFGLELFETKIGQRKAVRQMLEQGKTVFESKNSIAKNEFMSLINEIKTILEI